MADDFETSSLLDQAAGALQTGRADEAERFAREALARAPADRRGLMILGHALLMSNRGADAIACFEPLAHDGDANAAANLAMALAQAGRLEDAVGWLQRATTARPDFAVAFQKLGVLQEMLGRDVEAEAALRQAVALAPEDLGSWLILGQLALKRHALDDARRAFSQVLEHHPSEPHAAHGLAWVLVEDGDFARAAELFQRIIDRGAADPRVRIDRAYCLQELGRWEEAQREYQAAVANAPEAYSRALNAVVGAGRGRLWLKPSAAAKALGRSR